MFEKITEKRVSEASVIINSLTGYNYESIVNSSLNEFTKNFVLMDNDNFSAKENLMKSVDKSVKLFINYTVRPKWTLLNYIFGSIESKPSQEIIRKVEIFTFYHYYLELIRNISADSEQVSVKKLTVESALDSVNKDIYDKLTTDITSLKIKNLFVQIFRLKYGDQSEISLDMCVPYSFIKLFLEDKGYTDLVVKFGNDFDDVTEVELKTIIKILSGKYYRYESTEALKVDDVFIQTSASPAAKTKEPEIKKEEAKESLQAADKEPVKKFVKEPVKVPFKEPGKEPVKEPVKEIIRETPKKTEPSPAMYTGAENTGNALRYLFKEEEIKTISKKVFNGSRHLMTDTLSEIEKLNSWRETTELLKNIFKNNKVNYYDKTVILFVDILSDYFEKRER